MDDAFEEQRKKNADKWALDQQLQFKALTRRNKLLGLWAAAERSLTAATAARTSRKTSKNKGLLVYTGCGGKSVRQRERAVR